MTYAQSINRDERVSSHFGCYFACDARGVCILRRAHRNYIMCIGRDIYSIRAGRVLCVIIVDFADSDE